MSIVSLNAISKAYGDKVIFSDFSLSLEEGDYTAIIGRSGAGKSTLLNILGLLETCDSGTYTIDGIQNPTLDSKAGTELLRYKISYLFQNYALINSETVAKNVEIGIHFLKLNKQQKKELIQKALERVGLDGFADKKVYQLSGGEQQRVALARILYKPSKLILADEPTGNLDSYNRDMIMNILQELNAEGKTILLVSHDQEVVKCAKKVVKI